MFSIIMPMDTNRLEQFKNTKRVYDKMPQAKEFLIPTRSEFQVARYLDDNKLMNDVRLLPYQHKEGYNPAKALNIGAREAKFDQIIITSPEIMPITEVLGQLEGFVGKNVLCEVMDEDESGEISMCLVNSNFRNKSPAFYFLAMFNKKDVESINGWDEDFMKGYAYEDNDFGERWNRAGLPFIIVDEIKARHQYHPRGETIQGGTEINRLKFEDNNNRGVVWADNGLVPSNPTP